MLADEPSTVVTLVAVVAEPTVNELPNVQAIPEDPVVTKIEPAAPEWLKVVNVSVPEP